MLFQFTDLFQQSIKAPFHYQLVLKLQGKGARQVALPIVPQEQAEVGGHLTAKHAGTRPVKLL